MNLPSTLSASLALSLLACSSGNKADLPAGWEGAESVTSFTQAQCSGSADGPDSPPESIDVSPGSGAVSVVYHAAHFRCAQSVHGFVRTGPKSLDLLVQPVDMNPTSVAGCDCLYEISLGAKAPAGPTTVTLYRRWDSESGSTDPLEIGTSMVTVR